MAIRPVLVSTLIFIIAVIAIVKIYSSFHRPLVHHINSDMQIIGVVDTNESHEVSIHNILNGDESILIVDHASLLYQSITQEIPQAKFLSQEEIFNVNNLHLFDKNTQGILAAQDPIFKHLFIIRFYDNGHQNAIKTLPEAGIRGIYTNRTPTGDYEVLMADGSQRTLYSISKIEKNR